MHFQQGPRTTILPIQAHNMPTNFQGLCRELEHTRLFAPKRAGNMQLLSTGQLSMQLLQTKRQVIIQHTLCIMSVGEVLAQYPVILG